MATVTTTPATTRARDAVLRVHARIAGLGHDLPVRLWDGTERGPADAGWRLVLPQPWSLRSALLPPTDLNAGEAYAIGEIDIEGSMVAALRDIARANRAELTLPARGGLLRDLLTLPAPPPRPGTRRAALAGRRHTRHRDRAAVRFHYDLPTGFYELFLDPQLVYSCAYYADGDDDLAAAQTRKLELICRKLHLRPGERLLDVGCGWGALVIHAARVHGVRALGVTLAGRQAAVARERVAAAGLDDRVEIRVQDYREVDGCFDAVASVGMFEHVGAGHLAEYFAAARRLTAPGGRFLNHGITTGARRKVRDLGRDRRSFVGRYVFPDGALVPASDAVRHVEDAGFELLDVEQLRPHYARTLTHWVANLETNADAARELAGEQVFRVWRAYMAGSVIGFETNDLGVVQILAANGEAELPLGRDRMLSLG